MLRKLGIAAATVGALYAGFCGFMFTQERSLIYKPTPAHDEPGAERIELPSGAETLRIWSRPDPGPAALIYFGGNSEDVAKPFEAFAAALPGRALYFVNYRGYGGSTGTPSEAGLFADAQAVFDAVHARHADVTVVGRSLGTGVAVYLAASRPVAKLVLVTPYDSIASVAQGRYPILPVALLMRDKFDSASRVGAVKAPTLALLAEHDWVIPPERSRALLEKFPAAQVRVETIRGTDHASIAHVPEYFRLIAGFLGT